MSFLNDTWCHGSSRKYTYFFSKCHCVLFKGSEGVMRTAVLWSWFRHHLPIVITENGFGDTKGYGVNDYNSRGAYHSVSYIYHSHTWNQASFRSLFIVTGVRSWRRTCGFSLQANIGGLVRAANEFNIPIISYHAWALLDIFEFSAGYEQWVTKNLKLLGGQYAPPLTVR